MANWVFVAWGGGPTALLGQARQFPFSTMGRQAALAATERILPKDCPQAAEFTLRVVVTEDRDRHGEIVEAWRLEGKPAPRNVVREEPE
jgi:hypothetical protein